MRASWWSLLLAASLMAGCSDGDAEPDGAAPPSPPEAPPAPAPPAEPAPPGLPAFVMEHHACRQFHLFFQLPAELYAEGMPEGFAPSPAGDPAGVMTIVYVHVSVCPSTSLNGTEAGELQEFWASVVVTPPEELAQEGVEFHALALEGVVSNEAIAHQYRAWGFGDALESGSVAISDLPVAPGGSGAHTTVVAEIGTYELVTQVSGPAEGSVAGAVKVFGASGGAVSGAFVYAWPGWTDLGLGTVEATFRGDPLAGPPPLSHGDAHAVTDTDVYYAGAAAASTEP
ncbi:MAG: hypothetical protein ACRDH5_03885 [bacterium]